MTSIRYSFDLTRHSFIMADPALCMCEGLFRHIRSVDQDYDSVELRLETEYGERWKMAVQSRELLGGFDLAILQGVSSLCVRASMLAEEELRPSADIAELLFSELHYVIGPESSYPAEQSTMLTSAFSLMNLLRVIGISVNGRNVEFAKRSLQRLSQVSMRFDDKNASAVWESFRLISYHAPTGQGDRGHRVYVGLNPRLGRYLKRKERHHARISLLEVRKLGADFAARILHQRLCAIVDDDGTRALRMRTLLGYMYPQDEMTRRGDEVRALRTASYAKLIGKPKLLEKERIEQTKTALNVLAKELGWKVKVVRDGKTKQLDTLWEIERTKSSMTKHEVKASRSM